MSEMNDKDAQRIVRARALAWEALSGDEQAEWLRRVDDTFAELEQSASRPLVPPSESERTPLRIVTAPCSRPIAEHPMAPAPDFAESWRRLSCPQGPHWGSGATCPVCHRPTHRAAGDPS